MAKKREIDFPDCWEELFPTEWMYLLKLHFKLQMKQNVTLRDVKCEWCRFVLSNRGINKKDNIDYFVLIDNLADTLTWMYQESEDGKEITMNFETTKNLLPEWKYLKGPLSHGSDLTFREFRSAVQMMNSYNETKDVFFLQALCGILYRKPGMKIGKSDFDGLYREQFLQTRINFYADRAKIIPVQIMWGIYVWFSYFCWYLLNGTFIIDGNELCFSSVFSRNKKEDDGQPKEQSLGMNGVLFSVAESGVFGNFDETDNTLLLKVMMKLLSDKMQADEILRKI